MPNFDEIGVEEVYDAQAREELDAFHYAQDVANRQADLDDEFIDFEDDDDDSLDFGYFDDDDDAGNYDGDDGRYDASDIYGGDLYGW